MTLQTPTAGPRPIDRPRPSPSRGAESRPARGDQATAATTAAAPTARRLSLGLRTLVLAIHVLVGVGWSGIVAAKLVLEVAAATSPDRAMDPVAYVFMATLDRVAFPPAAMATLVTGLVLSIGTAWGLFRYWWIVVKLVLTVAVIVTGVAFVGAWTQAALAAASDPAAAELAGPGIGSPDRWLIGAGVAHLLMLGAATVVSVYRPWGRIRPDQRVSAPPIAPDRAA
jgi:hypothetical protein